MSGQKRIEVRTQNTNIRERVAIYATRTEVKQIDLEWLKSIHIQIPPLNKGCILGTVELTDSIKFTNSSEFRDFANWHLCDPSMFQHKTNVFGWYVNAPEEIELIPFKMPRGAIVWSKIDDELIAEAKLK